MVDHAHIEKLFVAAHLSATEQDVLVFIINNLDHIDSLGVRDVAEGCFTSSTTVIRLAKKLGYRGYREMVFELRRLSLSEAMTTGAMPAAQTADAELLRRTYTQGDYDTLHKGLNQQGVIVIYGEGWCTFVASYIEKKLIAHGYRTINHDLLGTNTLLSGMPDITLSIFISKGGSTVAVVEAARRCRRRGIPTVVFTGNPRGKLTAHADGTFVIPDDNPFDSENRSKNLFFARCIAVFEELFALHDGER